MSQHKVIAILGATATGKSELAIELAKLLPNSLIVNCDSRQVYKDMDIGTAKVEGKWVSTKEERWKRYAPLGSKVFVYKDVVHCLIDYRLPGEPYSVVEYLRDWYQLIDTLELMQDPPNYILLVGGTGYFAQAVIKKLEPESYTQKIEGLENLPTYLLRSRYYHSVLYEGGRLLNTSDFHNRERLINYNTSRLTTRDDHRFVIQQVFALKMERHLLQERIAIRTATRLNEGLYTEFYDLQKKYPGLELGRYAFEYSVLQQENLGWIKSEEVAQQINKATIAYVKKQNTWLTKMKTLSISNLNELLDNL